MPGERTSLTRIDRPLSRRAVLRAGSAGLAGLSLPGLLRAAENGKSGARCDAAIVIYLNGGPSHLDMWDMKPAAPREIRGEFEPIPTSADGISLCEHLPKLAGHMHRASVVRSMHHSVNDSHALAVYAAMTGHDKGDAKKTVGESAEDHPTPGSVLTHLRPSHRSVVPYVAMPYRTKEGATGPPQPGFGGGFLGQAYDPLWVLENPAAADFQVPSLVPVAGLTPDQIAHRRQLLAGLTNGSPRRERTATFDAIDGFQARAFDLLTSPAASRAFRISEEPAAVRERYGMNIYGQSVLLARRLIEAGTKLVNISWAPDANATWDTHSGNFKKLKGTLLPEFDAAASSLLADLAERGLLDRTLVAVTGDFGRSPKINNSDGGRDHWNYCYTVMLAGGGVKRGFVYGASDRTGALPSSHPVTPGDLIATIYHLFGLDPKTEIHDRLQRPFPIAPAGEVIGDLVG